jgi:hypothetical protein
MIDMFADLPGFSLWDLAGLNRLPLSVLRRELNSMNSRSLVGCDCCHVSLFLSC